MVFFSFLFYCAVWIGVWGLVASLPQPNVILILVDDLGYKDLGIQGSEDVKSPNIDKLATDGVRFTDGYAPHHFCGPSRSGLLSGIGPFRYGASLNAPKSYWDKTIGLPLDLEIMPETVKKAGYRTYCIGKWHLGHTAGHHPKNRGFDKFFGFLKGSWNYKVSKMYDPQLKDYDYIYREFNKVNNISYVTDDFTDAALAYINNAKRKKQPFFMYLSYNAPHGPFLTLKEDLDPNVPEDRRTHVAMIKSLDRGVGKIRNYLIEQGMEKDTVFFFSNDNGGHKKGAINDPLNNYKGSYREGGMRVPWFMTWPGTIAQGQVVSKIVSHLDIYPTLESLAQVPAEHRNPDLEGKNILPYIKFVGQDAPEKNGEIHPYLAFGGPHKDGTDRGMIRSGMWKLIVNNATESRIQLYNLMDDIGESTNIANEHPNRVESMLRTWNTWNVRNVPPSYPKTREPSPLRLELSVVGDVRETTTGSPVSFEASGTHKDGGVIKYLWEAFIPSQVDKALFRDVWRGGVESTSREESSITITFKDPGSYTVRVNVETERWVEWEDVEINVT
ncbi:hypothetical protein NDN08_004857 [Rhodosorus marinus]|uniref:Sulfatase N-terminal domain-containing protein n=1 Tax=Rhodosorus marinus TaxID=101924 RepID=A0AAV8UET5_9RHOD|nr:hypothetical protein NDN08_004857 [Rhodosorus marinus]